MYTFNRPTAPPDICTRRCTRIDTQKRQRTYDRMKPMKVYATTTTTFVRTPHIHSLTGCANTNRSRAKLVALTFRKREIATSICACLLCCLFNGMATLLYLHSMTLFCFSLFIAPRLLSSIDECTEIIIFNHPTNTHVESCREKCCAMIFFFVSTTNAIAIVNAGRIEHRRGCCCCYSSIYQA